MAAKPSAEAWSMTMTWMSPANPSHAARTARTVRTTAGSSRTGMMTDTRVTDVTANTPRWRPAR
ncbi:MAG: hypothetical protein IPG47_09725 [Thermoflexaceae bacterium]|nr:hypothetical protein [Thermoflexaceae bacterium]